MGKIIRLGDVNFTENLGKVTIIDEVVNNIVNSYLSKIGNDSYKNQLSTMVTSLIEEDVWDDMAIYPILGDTLAKMCINLNEDASFNYNLVTASNASAGDKHILFSNEQDIVSPQTIQGFEEEGASLIACDQFLFACIERTTESPNVAYFAANLNGGEWALQTKMNNGTRSYGKAITIGGNNAFGITTNSHYSGEKVYCIWSCDDTNINAKFGVSDMVSYPVGSSYIRNNNFVGASASYVPSGSPSGFIAEGKMHFYAFAHKKMTSAKMLKVYNVFKTFIESVGK